MLKAILKRQVANFISLVLVASFFLQVQDSYAIYDGDRSTGYSESSHMCSTGSFDFDPFGSNKDIEWKLDNPICISFIAIQGLLIMGAGYVVAAMCRPTNTIGQKAGAVEAGEEAAVPDSPLITPITGYKLARRSLYCVARSLELTGATSAMTVCMVQANATLGASAQICIPFSLEVGKATADQTRCCTAYAAYAAAVALGVAALAIIYASAKGAYESARICGYDWNSWKQVDDNGDFDSGLKKTRWRLGVYPGSRQYCVEDIFVGHQPRNSNDVVYNSCGYSGEGGLAANALTIKNKYFREYLYAGEEKEDEGGGSCNNPTGWDAAHRLKNLGYTSNAQRYYMTGPGGASNYACHRFILEAGSDPSASEAYECCKRRSQETICIENAPMAMGSIQGSYDSTFCELNSKCSVAGIIFETYSSKKASNFICAKTYSVCPYNHLLGGGTEVGKYITDPGGAVTNDIENFCQYRKHCVKIPVMPYVRMSSLEGAYISAACKNLKGDSQNVYSYSADLLPISSRGFAAPLVQCFKESIENALLNRAGDTKCKNPDETASHDFCSSGYLYKKDQPLAATSSFFVKIQNGLRDIIKIALTISITLLGAMVLLGASPLSKKQLLMYILKIGLVMYFAVGTGWQFGFVDGILGSSNYISDIMMRIDDPNAPENKKDGCQFPRFNYADQNEATKYDNPAYSPGREYLKIWDTLDCKLARALGFGPELSVPNLVKMILAGFLTGGLGIMFLVATFMFAFFMLSVTMRAIHIFLMASVAIVILIYVSPITITLAMFERTKGIFEGWWKQVLGLALQPVILFAYLGVYIALFDNIVIGKATFNGDGHNTQKSIVCNSESANTSIYCIFRVADLKTFSGLEVIGIGLPVLASMNKEKMNTIIKSAFIMFIFAGFIDKISELAAKLVGGSELKSNSMSAMSMAKKSFGALNAIQERATRGMIKHGGAAAKSYAKGVAKRAEQTGYQGSGQRPSLAPKAPDATPPDAAVAADKPEPTSNRAPDAMPAADDKAQSFSQASAAVPDAPKDATPEQQKETQKAKDDSSAMIF